MEESKTDPQSEIFRKIVGIVMVVCIVFGLLELAGVLHV
jgi:hypothetical protein